MIIDDDGHTFRLNCLLKKMDMVLSRLSFSSISSSGTSMPREFGPSNEMHSALLETIGNKKSAYELTTTALVGKKKRI